MVSPVQIESNKQVNINRLNKKVLDLSQKMYNCHFKTYYVISISLENLICRQVYMLVIFFPAFLWMFCVCVRTIFCLFNYGHKEKEIKTKSLKLTGCSRILHTQLFPLEN